MSTLEVLLQDLHDEHDDLEAMLVGMTDADWPRPTSSVGWNVADQVAHLTYFDEAAATAILDPTRFASLRAQLEESLQRSVQDVDELTIGPLRPLPSAQLLAEWVSAGDRLRTATRSLEPGQRVVWYGPTMSAESFITARLMETWAHGDHVAESIGASRAPSNRLRHIAHLGYITRRWSFVNRGLAAPDAPVHVRLDAPDGTTWSFGDPNATDTVSGSALDFCRVVTQRRHLDDTHLEVSGAAAREWLLVAQAFAGPPTNGPSPAGA